MCDLDAPVKGGGSTLRQTLLQAKKSKLGSFAKTAQKQLQLPTCPKTLRYLVGWARDLQGKDPITFCEIKAWAELMQITLNPWEVEILMRLDTIYHTRVVQAQQ